MERGGWVRQARVLQLKNKIQYNKKEKRKHKSIPRDKSDRRTLDQLLTGTTRIDETEEEGRKEERDGGRKGSRQRLWGRGG